MLALTAIGNVRRRGLLLIGITLGYGACLVLFASSDVFTLSLVLITGVGAMAAAFDAMQWVLLQQYVPDHMRGRAIGGWVFAIGFGWVGYLALGARRGIRRGAVGPCRHRSLWWCSPASPRPRSPPGCARHSRGGCRRRSCGTPSAGRRDGGHHRPRVNSTIETRGALPRACRSHAAHPAAASIGSW